MATKPDDQGPLKGCTATDCRDCQVADDLVCHYTTGQLVRFLLLSLPGFILGGIGLWAAGAVWLAVWIGLAVAFFMFIEIRVMCSHCPHYGQPGSSLSCWANYGAPKLWTYRPGPMSGPEKTVFFGGFAVIWGLPAVVMLARADWIYLVLFLAATAVFFVALAAGYCSRCQNLACPLNRVPESTRRAYFDGHPDEARAWGRGAD